MRLIKPFLLSCSSPRGTLAVSSLPMQVINCFRFTLIYKHVSFLKLISKLSETGMLG